MIYWLYLIAFFRFFLPPLLFWQPILITFLVTFGDAMDGYFAFKSGWKWNFYNRYDKILDWWWYFFILLYFVGKPEFLIILFMFIERSVGQILCLIYNKTHFLVWFPNIIENYFYFYLGNTLFHFPIFDNQIILILVGLIFGIIREYITHIEKVSLSKYWGLGVNWHEVG